MLDVSVVDRDGSDVLEVSGVVVELPGLVELATCDESVRVLGVWVEAVGSSSRLVLDGPVALLEVVPPLLVDAILVLLPVSRVALLEASGLVRGSSGVVDVGVVPVLATSVESVLLRPPVELANSDELVELLDGALLVAAVVSLEELVLEVLGLPSVVVDEVLLDGVLVELAIFAVDPV